jgi:hypothetical protein
VGHGWNTDNKGATGKDEDDDAPHECMSMRVFFIFFLFNIVVPPLHPKGGKICIIYGVPLLANAKGESIY